MVDYAKCYLDNGDVDPDMVVRSDGVELRRSNSDLWLEYKVFAAGNGHVFDKMPPGKWDNLNANAKRRLKYAKPGQ